MHFQLLQLSSKNKQVRDKICKINTYDQSMFMHTTLPLRALKSQIIYKYSRKLSIYFSLSIFEECNSVSKSHSNNTILVGIEFIAVDFCGRNVTAPQDLYDNQTTITPCVFLVAFHQQWICVKR